MRLLLNRSLLHESTLVFLWWSARNFTIFSHESSLELLDLLVILHKLAFDLGYNLLG